MYFPQEICYDVVDKKRGEQTIWRNNDDDSRKRMGIAMKEFRLQRVKNQRFGKFLLGTVLAYLVSCVVIGGYVLLSHGPAARGLGGLAAAFFLLAFPLVRKIGRLKIAPLMDATLIIFIFLAFHLGVALGLYSYVWWYDLAVHCLSGAVFALVGLCLYWMTREDKRAPMEKNALSAAGYAFFFSGFIAVLWEIFEFVADILTGNDSQNVAATGVTDTMEDMMICLVGGLFMAAVIWLHLKGRRRFLLMRPAEEFYRANYGEEQEEGQ